MRSIYWTAAAAADPLTVNPFFKKKYLAYEKFGRIIRKLAPFSTRDMGVRKLEYKLTKLF